MLEYTNSFHHRSKVRAVHFEMNPVALRMNGVAIADVFNLLLGHSFALFSVRAPHVRGSCTAGGC